MARWRPATGSASWPPRPTSGAAIAGPFGLIHDKRYDVLGKTVNTGAQLDSTGITLSVAAFHKLGPALRKRFRKHTAPIFYIRNEDPRRFRARRD